eukprot:TRINITY_DN13226_c0_g1_i1.p1 TRINITY_DN13226_c0_g1~~TRINITY_DN13226_c0_g1_i1.p1  ORF type:complete len:225 (+),score=51.61 TRINITY_DN13226_c0_g1_i1:35-709(+)
MSLNPQRKSGSDFCNSPNVEASSAARRKYFLRILKTPDLCYMFREFLVELSCAENLSFWMAVETFKNLSNTVADQSILQTSVSAPSSPSNSNIYSTDTAKQHAKEIYKKYIDNLADCPINIDCDVKNDIKQNYQKPTRDIFDEAQATVFALMETDSFQKFIASSKYKSFSDVVPEKTKKSKSKKKVEAVVPAIPKVNPGQSESVDTARNIEMFLNRESWYRSRT